jgi:phage major head subunit gpT-like protein
MDIVNKAALATLTANARKEFMDAFTNTPVYWEKVAMRISSSALKETYNWDDVVPRLVEWLGDREMHGLKAEGYDLTNIDYAVGLSIKRKDIEDDRLGIHKTRIQTLGQEAAWHRDSIVFDLLKEGDVNLCFDGKAFFASDHPGYAAWSNIDTGGAAAKWYLLDCKRPIKPLILQVRKEPEFTAIDKSDSPAVFSRAEYQYGIDDRKVAGYSMPWMAYRSNQTLNATNLKAAIVAMNAFVDSKGRPLGINPDTLVVPPSLKFTAKKLLVAELIADGAGAFETNDLAGEIPIENLVVSPYVTE